MKKLFFVFIQILIGVNSVFAQKISRDPNPRKDVANVFYKTEYTLHDLWSDEPIFPDANGIYHIYHATNENKTPKEFRGTGRDLSGMTVYKFKNYNNCKNWCGGVVYTIQNTQADVTNNTVVIKNNESNNVNDTVKNVQSLGENSSIITDFYNINYVHQQFDLLEDPLSVLDAKVDASLGKNYAIAAKEKLENLLKGYAELKKQDSVLTNKLKTYEKCKDGNCNDNKTLYNALKKSDQIIDFGVHWTALSKKIEKSCKWNNLRNFDGKLYKSNKRQIGYYDYSYHLGMRSGPYKRTYIIIDPSRNNDNSFYKIVNKALKKYPDVFVQENQKQSFIENETGLDEEFFKLTKEKEKLVEMISFIEKNFFLYLPQNNSVYGRFSFIGNTKNGIPQGFGYLLNEKRQLLASAYWDEGFPIVLYNVNIFHNPESTGKDYSHYGKSFSTKHVSRYIYLDNHGYKNENVNTFRLYFGEYTYVAAENTNYLNGYGCYFHSAWDKNDVQYYAGFSSKSNNHGQGKHVSSTSVKEGNWENGNLVYGTITSKVDNSVYTGQIKDWRMNGLGKKIYTNGKIEEGLFENGYFLKTYAEIERDRNQQELEEKLAEMKRQDELRAKKEKEDAYVNELRKGFFALVEDKLNSPSSSNNNTQNDIRTCIHCSKKYNIAKGWSLRNEVDCQLTQQVYIEAAYGGYSGNAYCSEKCAKCACRIKKGLNCDF